MKSGLEILIFSSVASSVAYVTVDFKKVGSNSSHAGST